MEMVINMITKVRTYLRYTYDKNKLILNFQRLMTMESLQDKIETEISNIKVGIETTNDELMRR